MRVPYQIVAAADAAIFGIKAISIEDMWDAYISMLVGFNWSRLDYERQMLSIIDGDW
jgi:hypothetical protein